MRTIPADSTTWRVDRISRSSVWRTVAYAYALTCIVALSLGAADESVGSGKSYLALGDSYTIGEGVDPAARWPVQLVTALTARGVPLEAPRIIARTGWTTRDLLAAIHSLKPPGPFDLVTLQIGVNDQYQGNDPELFRRDLRLVLSEAVLLAGGRSAHVIAVSIPDWGVTPFARGQDAAAIGTDIDAFNAVLRAEASAAGVACVSVTESSRQAGRDPTLVVADGLHPSAALYARWVALIAPPAAVAAGRP